MAFGFRKTFRSRPRTLCARAGALRKAWPHAWDGWAFGGAIQDAAIKLVLCEGWPVPDPSIYALPADVTERMDQLLTADFAR